MMFASLPAHVQQQAREAYRLFQQNPQHPGLHFRRVLDDPPTFAAQVGIGYRAIAGTDGDTWVWFWIGSHADYDKLLGDDQIGLTALAVLAFIHGGLGSDLHWRPERRRYLRR